MSWDSNMDDGLIESLVESIKARKINGRAWDESVWEPAKNVVFNKSHKVVRKSHMKSRLRTLQKELKGFNELLNKSRFGWDYMKKTVTASAACWDELLSDKKVVDKYKSFRFRDPKWNLDNLTMISGTNYATGNYSIGRVDTEDIDDVFCPDMSGLVDEDKHLEDIEENPSVPLTDSTRKRLAHVPPLEK
ncbi:hypothetical protein GIB67_024394 [Kingdonia uniflora]|uniref:Myb/SANT-like domain-containing protein n=1 Tax=Kingdonia uniflora TaxID=39325 RepID=A0A7J7LFJ4_9MAGN|nr:hypothetical protein GIB67_024394 [Kingdonia uniflora]